MRTGNQLAPPICSPRTYRIGGCRRRRRIHRTLEGRAGRQDLRAHVGRDRLPAKIAFSTAHIPEGASGEIDEIDGPAEDDENVLEAKVPPAGMDRVAAGMAKAASPKDADIGFHRQPGDACRISRLNCGLCRDLGIVRTSQQGEKLQQSSSRVPARKHESSLLILS